jgi:hypothetical protein
VGRATAEKVIGHMINEVADRCDVGEGYCIEYYTTERVAKATLVCL